MAARALKPLAAAFAAGLAALPAVGASAHNLYEQIPYCRFTFASAYAAYTEVMECNTPDIAFWNRTGTLWERSRPFQWHDGRPIPHHH